MEIKKIAEIINGKILGDEDFEIEKIEVPEKGDENSCIFIFDEKVKERIKGKVGCVITSEEFIKGISYRSAILVKDVKRAFVQVLNLFSKKREIKGISPFSHISRNSIVEENVHISPFCVVEDGAVIKKNTYLYPFVYVGENSKIGENCIIHSNVYIGDNCEIGNNCQIFAGVVIGADGFGYIDAGNGLIKIPQIGKVVIEDDCEIGANTTIDRATIGETRIKRGTKIDNLVQIAHNCEIGEFTVIAAQTGIAGSSRIGKKVKIGGQVGIADHLNIGDGAILTAKAGVAKDVPPGKVYSGYFAREHSEVLKAFTILYSLPKYWDKIKKILEKFEF